MAELASQAWGREWGIVGWVGLANHKTRRPEFLPATASASASINVVNFYTPHQLFQL